MKEPFPLNVRLSQIRGITKVLTEFSKPVELSKLSSEINEEIDDLLPIINASEMLGLIKISGGSVGITKIGKALANSTSTDIIKGRIRRLEPFRTILSILGQEKSMSTEELIKELEGSGLSRYRGEPEKLALVNLLLNVGVRCSILKYSRRRDVWQINK